MIGFEKVKGYKCVVIAYTGEIFLAESFEKPQPYRHGQLRKAYTEAIKNEGKLYFAYQEGEIVKEEVVSKINLENTIVDDGGKEQTYAVEVTERQTSTLE